MAELGRTPFRFFLIMLAVVLFFVAAIPYPTPEPPWKFRLIAAGLFCWCLSTIIPL